MRGGVIGDNLRERGQSESDREHEEKHKRCHLLSEIRN
jgi:hypothetical protein